MSIKAADVKILREKTGAGMMDCKRALVDANGDSAKAEEILKELGLVAAGKREGRATNEGRIFACVDGAKAAMLELSCETDFVSRNSEFIQLGKNLLENILKQCQKLDPTQLKGELEAQLKATMSRIKENMNLKRYDVLNAADNEFLIDYIHGEGRIGVVVKFVLSDPDIQSQPAFRETAFDFALHVAAFAPLYISRDKIEPGYIKDQEELFKKQTENDESNQQKPEKVIEAIVKGKTSKHLAGICLLDQGFVRDEKVKCKKILEQLGKELGGTVVVSEFLYYKVGSEA